MAQRESLKVTKRTVLGKKIKKLRKEGILPANVYGKDMKSEAVQVPLKDFLDVYHVAHETGLVDLGLDSQTIPVLIHSVQIDPKSQTPLHADFFKVNLREKITTKVPVVAVGEPKAVADKVGLLEQPISEIEVEALPTDLPEKIEVNVENLAAVDEQILVSDLKVDAGVTVLSEESQVVFKIGELVTKEMEEQAAADAAETAEAVAEAAEEGGEAAEGETPAEGGEEKTENSPAGEATEEAPKE
ncbi:MAG TPA: 50S ribosomal protein L25 [Patescibacteria group bacterium]|nr:50S ribosomal protein L25 [Patescibacteria group bacterium]